MKKRFTLIAIAIIVIVTAVFLFTSGRGSTHKEAEHLQKPFDSAKLLYNRAEKFLGEERLPDAKNVYKELLTQYPDSNLVRDARAKLDELNIRILFSPISTDDSIFYEVKPGDTLGKIANEFGTTVELIMKSNNLTNTIIRPGQRLKISKARYSILVDKSQNILILRGDDEALKTYKVSTGADNSTPAGIFRIENKLVKPTWYRAGAIVPPDSPENILGTRWMGLTISGYGIHGTVDPSSIGTHITKGCVRMNNEDVEELYAIVPVGAEVTIID